MQNTVLGGSMKLRIILTIWLLILGGFMYSNEVEKAVEELFEEIKSKEFTSDLDDLSFLKEAIGNKRVVLLGEQDHGDGTIAPLKARIVKYLHQEMGFNVILFESDYFSYNKRLKYDNNDELTRDDIKRDHWFFWSKNQELHDFYNYLADKQETLFVEGFDCNYTLSRNSDGFLDYHQDYIGQGMIALSDEDRDFYLAFTSDLFTKQNSYELTDLNKERFLNITKRIIEDNQSNSQYLQDIKNLRRFALAKWSDSKNRLKNRNTFMYENIMWFLNDKYQDEKVIIWAHNQHICKDYTQVIPQDEIAAIEADGWSMNWIGSDAGELLYKDMPNDIFSIGAISYSGNYNHQAFQYDFTSSSPIESDNDSVESYLHKQNIRYGFLNLEKLNNMLERKDYKLADQHNEAGVSNWFQVFDGLIYIDSMEVIKTKN
jgi:erythromycin esterase